MNPYAGAKRAAHCLTAITMKIGAWAKACGKSSGHNPEIEDLRALSFQSSAFTGVEMAAIDRSNEWKNSMSKWGQKKPATLEIELGRLLDKLCGEWGSAIT